MLQQPDQAARLIDILSRAFWVEAEPQFENSADVPSNGNLPHGWSHGTQVAKRARFDCSQHSLAKGAIRRQPRHFMLRPTPATIPRSLERRRATLLDCDFDATLRHKPVQDNDTRLQMLGSLHGFGIGSAGRCSHVFGLFVRFTWPLAIMPSADRVPVKSLHSTMHIPPMRRLGRWAVMGIVLITLWFTDTHGSRPFIAEIG
jgi:hypothetical protein